MEKKKKNIEKHKLTIALVSGITPEKVFTIAARPPSPSIKTGALTIELHYVLCI